MKSIRIGTRIASSAVILITLVRVVSAQVPSSAPATPVRDLMSDTWVATDALGRSLPAGAAAPAPRGDRFVGIFYFLTHGNRAYFTSTDRLPYGDYGDDPRILRDNTVISQQVGGNPFTHPEGWKAPGAYWWGEPAVGYFLADDPYVARKNLEMLADAGVDTLIFDVTNVPQYVKAYENVLDTAVQMRRAGLRTPQFLFITYSSSGPVANELYDRLYAKGQYRDLWFLWNGKPLILGDPNGSKPTTTPPRPEVQPFFTWRYSWANTSGPNQNGKDEWQWIDARGPQTFGWHDDPKIPEEVPVSIGGWAHEELGRSFVASQTGPGRGTEPPIDAADLAANTPKGTFFQQQWDRALQIDPQFIFVTGWNEWTAGRQYAPGVGMLGHTTGPGQYYFVDEYNAEFSRDAMPMRGGFGDNYYMQLAENIRRYKGARPVPVAHGWRTLSLDGGFAPWRNIAPLYLDAVGDTTHRDWPGWGGKHYINATGRNDITSARVACDRKNIYFYVQTAQAMTPYEGGQWMQLLIDTGAKKQTDWNGYDFILNQKIIDGSTTTLHRFSDGKEWPVPYRVVKNEMMVIVPRALIGLTDLHHTTFDFHWIDNAAAGPGADIAAWWYDGDSAPDGRFNYRYINQ